MTKGKKKVQRAQIWPISPGPSHQPGLMAQIWGRSETPTPPPICPGRWLKPGQKAVEKKTKILGKEKTEKKTVENNNQKRQ